MDKGAEYRCNETVDIEEITGMYGTNKEDHTKFTVTATYKSGRTESFSGNLNKGGVLPKTAANKVQLLRAFPTVTNVEIATR